MKSRKFMANMAVYLLGNILGKLITIFLLPLYTKNLSPADYGFYDLAISTCTVIVPIVFFNIWDGILRFTFDHKKKDGKLKVVTTGLVVTAFFSVIMVFLAFVASSYLDIKYYTQIVIYTMLTGILYAYQYSARGLGKNIYFAFSGIVNSILTVVLSYLFLHKWNLGVNGLLIVNNISMVIVILILESGVSVRKGLKGFKLDKSLIKSMIIYSLPLIVNTISFWLLTTFNKYIIYWRLGAENNGYYAVANKFGMALNLFTSVFTLAWQESAFDASDSEQKSEYYTSGLNLYTRILGAGILVLIPFTILIFDFMVDSQYADSAVILPIFYLFTVVSAISSFLGTIFCAEKKTNVLLWSTLAGALVNTIVVFLSIDYIGLNSATVGMLAGFLFVTILRYRSINKTVAMKFDYKFIGLFFVLLAAVMWVYYLGNKLANGIAFAIFSLIALYLIRDIIKKVFDTLRGKAK